MVYIYHPLTPGYVHVAVKVKTKSAYWKMYSGIPTFRTSKGNKIGSKNQRVWEMGGGGVKLQCLTEEKEFWFELSGGSKK